jgi:microcystin-dependent protein
MALIAGVQYSGVPIGTILSCGHGIRINSMTTTGSPTTVTTSTDHNLVVGDSIVISATATTPTSTLAVFTVDTVPTSTTFTITANVTGGTTTGTVSKIPPRMLFCDGASYSITGAYANLFAVIGYTFGGSGSSFNVPDFRGRFLRGVDNGVSRDPDAASRSTMATGGNSGNTVGSTQSSAVADHNHRFGSPVTDPSGPFGTSSTPSTTQRLSNTAGVNNASFSSETRPINAYVNYCIAF